MCVTTGRNIKEQGYIFKVQFIKINEWINKQQQKQNVFFFYVRNKKKIKLIRNVINISYIYIYAGPNYSDDHI